jgi:molecular chaperone GrpE
MSNDKKLKHKEEAKDTKDNIEEVKDERDIKIASLEDQLKRAVADYRNLERRSSEERVEAIKFANKQLIEALLPAFDTLFLAGKYTTDESVQLTIGRMLEVLKDNGIEKVDTKNVEYNAETMECVEVVEGKGDEIIEEVRPGFTIHGKIIRPAQVKVGKGNEMN